MGALTYLFTTKLKNRIKNLLRSPGKLIYIIILIGLLAVSIAGSRGSSEAGGQPRDIGELIAGAVALYTLVFFLTLKSGFGNGASPFSMSDVNLIFPAPIKPRSILFFGLFQQIGQSVLLGLFLLFQYGWLSNLYAISLAGMLLLFFGYVTAIFLGQVSAMVIYSITSSSETRQKAVKYSLLVIVAAFLLYLLKYCLDNSMSISSLVEAVNSRVFSFFPVSGWLGSFISGVFSAKPLDIVLGAGLCVILLLLEICYILFGKLDFFEDVLKSTEASYSAITAAKEGSVREAVPQNIKLGRTGLKKGWGADAFYYKHLVENRRSRIFVADLSTLVFAACSVLFSFIMRDSILAVFAFTTYMQMFLIALGRINKELIKPYIYLVPEPPMKKLLSNLRESLSKYIFDAVLIFVPIAFIYGLSPLTAVLCILARISFASLFTAGNLLAERLWGSGGSKGIAITLYFVILLLLSLPGIALAIIMNFVFPIGILSPVDTALLSLFICNIPVSLLAFYLSRNMLQYAELNNR